MKYRHLHADDEIADELHLTKYPKAPTFEGVALKASERRGDLERICETELSLDRIVYMVKEPVTLAIWKRADG